MCKSGILAQFDSRHSKVQNNMRKLDAISHPAKHMNNKCTRRRFGSICGLNVPSLEAHGQAKAQRSRQTDSLCGTRSRQSRLEKRPSERGAKYLNGSICAEKAEKCWPLSNHPSKNGQTHSSLEKKVAARPPMSVAYTLYSVMQAVNDTGLCGALERLHVSPCALNSVIPLNKL